MKHNPIELLLRWFVLSLKNHPIFMGIFILLAMGGLAWFYSMAVSYLHG